MNFWRCGTSCVIRWPLSRWPRISAFAPTGGETRSSKRPPLSSARLNSSAPGRTTCSTSPGDDPKIHLRPSAYQHRRVRDGVYRTDGNARQSPGPPPGVKTAPGVGRSRSRPFGAIVINLISNAVKYRFLLVETSPSSTAAEDEYAVLRVERYGAEFRRIPSAHFRSFRSGISGSGPLTRRLGRRADLLVRRLADYMVAPHKPQRSARAKAAPFICAFARNRSANVIRRTVATLRIRLNRGAGFDR